MEFKERRDKRGYEWKSGINRNIMEFKAACSPVKILFNFELIET